MGDQDEMVEALRLAVDNETKRDALLKEALLRIQALEMRVSNLESAVSRHIGV